MTMKNITRIAALAAVLAALAIPASAQWGPEEEKNCTGAGSVTLAGQTGSGLDDSSKLQQFETIPKGVFVPCVNFKWTSDKNYFIDARGTKLGLDDQFASILAGKKGGAVLRLNWSQNPNWMSNTAQSPYSQTISGNTAYYHVPDGMRQALQNVYTPWVTPTAANPVGIGNAPANPTVPGFFAVEPWVADAPGIDLRYIRKTGRVGFDIPAGENFVFHATYGRETRDGNKNTTFYGGPNYEVATPIKYATDDFRFEGEFAKGKLFLNAALNFSNFNNSVEFAEIDNPERLQLANPTNGRAVINDVSTFRLWLPPDNKAYTLDLTAGYSLPAHHKITASLQTGNMKASWNLLPLSTNPNLQTSATAPDPKFSVIPPYGSVSPKYDTMMFNLRFTGDPNPFFGYIASYRKYELKDKTQEYEFLSSVRGDVGATQRVEGATGESGPLLREHFGWSVETLRGEVHVRPAHGLRLSLSYNEDKRKFDVGEFEDVKDKSTVGSVDWNWTWVALHGSYTHLKRDPGTAYDAPIWQGATFTDTASRTRNTWSGFLTLTPVEKFALTFNGQTQKNDFPESTTGLLAQKFDTFGVDATYAANEKLNLTVGYVYEKYYFDMAAAYIPRGLNPPYDPANLWGNSTTDKVDTFRAGLAWTLVPEKLTLDASIDYTKPRSDSQYDFSQAGTPIGGLNEANGVFPANVPPLAGFTAFTFDSFPQVVKKYTVAKIRLSYNIAKNLSAAVLYWKQKYDNTDWTTDQMQPYMGHVDPGANRWFFLGASVPSYNADIFRLSFTYHF